MTPLQQANTAAYQALAAIVGPMEAIRQLTNAIPKANVRDVADQVVRGTFDFAERQIAWKKTQPCAAAVFHAEMTKGPRFWRPWHRMMARRWAARCIASGHAHRCPGVEGT